MKSKSKASTHTWHRVAHAPAATYSAFAGSAPPPADGGTSAHATHVASDRVVHAIRIVPSAHVTRVHALHCTPLPFSDGDHDTPGSQSARHCAKWGGSDAHTCSSPLGSVPTHGWHANNPLPPHGCAICPDTHADAPAKHGRHTPPHVSVPASHAHPQPRLSPGVRLLLVQCACAGSASHGRHA